MHDVPAARALILMRRESQHSPTIPVRYDKSLRHGRDELFQKKTGVFVTGTNNALYEWTDSNGRVKLGGYLTPSLGYIAVVWYDRRLCARWRQRPLAAVL